jgi:muramoyltetrapeptide carboxypeptidase
MKRRNFIKNISLTTLGSGLLYGFKTDNTSPLKIKPNKLKQGDLIALTAPAGAIFSPKHIEKIEKKLADLGFKTIRGKTLFMQEGYLAGDDQFRATEFNDFIKNTKVKAILTMRGGWGCARILNLIDYDIIKQFPKIIIGYSDITALLIAINQKTGLITFHGPMGYSSWNTFSTSQLFNVLVEGKRYKLINSDQTKHQLQTLTPGKAKGELIGGNLTVVTSLVGTKFEPDWSNKILFLEETSEEPYRIDRMLWQLKLSGAFDQIKGCVLGAFNKCEAEDPQKSFSLEEVLNFHFGNQTFPVYKGASFGHVVDKFTLSIGINVSVNANQHYIELLERAVK